MDQGRASPSVYVIYLFIYLFFIWEKCPQNLIFGRFQSSLEQRKIRTDRGVLPTRDSAKWVWSLGMIHFPHLDILWQSFKHKVKQIDFPPTLIYCNKSSLWNLLEADSDILPRCI